MVTVKHSNRPIRSNDRNKRIQLKLLGIISVFGSVGTATFFGIFGSLSVQSGHNLGLPNQILLFSGSLNTTTNISASTTHNYGKEMVSVNPVEPEETRESFQERFNRLTTADPNQTTLAFAPLHFFSGYCNEVMVFTAFLMHAFDHNFTQVLLPSLRWKDNFGTRKLVAHEALFDVVKWNERAISTRILPRLVTHHPSMIHYNGRWVGDRNNATKPFAYGKQASLFVSYKRYLARAQERGRHPVDLEILKGALTPHPDLQKIISQSKQSLDSKSSYMCIHARIEPDMQKHGKCPEKKVISFEKILEDIYQEFPSPPVSQVLVVLNRVLLEKENVTLNPLAGQNLLVLNHLRQGGMWNGTVKVVEAGTVALPPESFFAQKPPTIAGPMLNYRLALDAEYFVGSEVSSYASHVMAARYHQGQRSSFVYTPTGIKKVGIDNEPPRFDC